MCAEREYTVGYERRDRRELAILGRMVRTGTVEKVIFEQTPEGRGAVPKCALRKDIQAAWRRLHQPQGLQRGRQGGAQAKSRHSPFPTALFPDPNPALPSKRSQVETAPPPIPHPGPAQCPWCHLPPYWGDAETTFREALSRGEKV